MAESSLERRHIEQVLTNSVEFIIKDRIKTDEYNVLVQENRHQAELIKALYTADDDTFPQQLQFGNGRIVGMERDSMSQTMCLTVDDAHGAFVGRCKRCGEWLAAEEAHGCERKQHMEEEEDDE